jgi:hypothetical protein
MSQNAITKLEESFAVESTVGPVVQGGQKQAAVFEYNFDKHGGAVSMIILPGPLLPNGAVITDAYMKVITALTSSASGEVSVGAVAADDIQTAAAVSGAPWSTTGLKDVVAPEPGTESGYLTLTANGRIRMDITVGALTAGRFKVIIAYDLP